VKCDVCDEEFDTENQLAQHKAKMHAGEPKGEMPVGDEGEKMPVVGQDFGMKDEKPEIESETGEGEDEGQEPYKRAVNE
jgi:hypothetical protein